MYNDSLFRVSLKCLIMHPDGRVLVVREKGRSSWDLPGGGIDHGETVQQAIARELYEEIHFSGKFSYDIMKVDDPTELRTRPIWQMKLVFRVTLDSLAIATGEDADDVMFIDAATLKDSPHPPEQAIYSYAQKA